MENSVEEDLKEDTIETERHHQKGLVAAINCRLTGEGGGGLELLEDKLLSRVKEEENKKREENVEEGSHGEE
jgi:hypothetical protein